MGIMMRFPEGKAKVFTMSYDDGIFQDYRLIDIMKKNNLKGTFNINAGIIASVSNRTEKGQSFISTRDR